MRKISRYVLMVLLPIHRRLLMETMRAAIIGCAGALAAGSWQSALATAAYFSVVLVLGWWLTWEAADTVAA